MTSTNATTVIDQHAEAQHSGVETNKHHWVSAGCEALAIFVLSFVICCWQVFYSGQPNLALLFDAQGYFIAAQQIPPTLAVIVNGFANYLLHGCSDAARVELAMRLADSGALELIKTGPLVPSLIALFYSIAKKPMLFAYWQTGVLGMIALQSSATVLIWSAAWKCGNRSVARIAAILSLIYPPFALNAGRLQSEVPAIFSVCFFLFAFSRKHENAADLKEGLLWGLASVSLILCRPMLALFPLMTMAFFYSLGQAGKRKIAICAATVLVAIAPWAAYKFIVTGKPSVSIDRYFAYNLYAGLNSAFDGFDIVSNNYVAQPHTFTKNVSQVLAEVVPPLLSNPAQAGGLFALKLSRLADSPWSDFQVDVLGTPWTLQIFLHQLLLVLAAMGSFIYLKACSTGPNRSMREVCNMGLLCALPVYHCLALLFISMRRYYFSAMPAVILLAALGIYCLFRQKSQRAVNLVALALLSPVVCLLLDMMSTDLCPALAMLSCKVGLLAVLALAGASVGFSLLAFLLAAQRAVNLTGRGRIVGMVLSVVASLLVAFTVGTRFSTLEYPWSLVSPLTVRIPVGARPTDGRWLLAFDLGTDERSFYDPYRAIQVEVNGTVLNGKIEPLVQADSRFREVFLNQAAFAYSSGRSVPSIRQWFYIDVPSALIRADSQNTVVVRDAEHSRKLFVYCDLAAGLNGRAHSLSLDEHSWTKGFMVHSKGDVRLDVWRNTTELYKRGSDVLQPRVLLIVAAGRQLSEDNVSVALPDVQLDETRRKRSVLEKVDPNSVSAFVESRKQEIGKQPSGLRCTISGEYKTQGKGHPSVCLIVTGKSLKGSETQYAPLSPQNLDSTNEWQSFEFSDTLPLANSPSEGNPLSIQVLFGLRNWWETLEYASYRGVGSVEFRKTKVTLSDGEFIHTEPARRLIFEAGCITAP